MNQSLNVFKPHGQIKLNGTKLKLFERDECIELPCPFGSNKTSSLINNKITSITLELLHCK